MNYEFQIGLIYNFLERDNETVVCSNARCIGYKDNFYVFETNDVEVIKKNNSWTKSCIELTDNYAKWYCNYNNGWTESRVEVVGYINNTYKLLFGVDNVKTISTK